MTQTDFDLFVIGGGSGGVRAARVAAGHGAKVAIAEEYRIGRHVRHPRLRPEEAARSMPRVSATISRTRRVTAGRSASGRHSTGPSLIANKDREIDRLERAYESNLALRGVTILKSARRARWRGRGAHERRLPRDRPD